MENKEQKDIISIRLPTFCLGHFLPNFYLNLFVQYCIVWKQTSILFMR